MSERSADWRNYKKINYPVSLLRGSLLKNPNDFQENHFENALIEALKNRVTVADSNFVWETENGMRKLKIPMLGWEIGYRIQGNKLFIGNHFEFLQECFSSESKNENEAQDFSDLTIIRPANRQEIFGNLFIKLGENESNFFSGNVASLLDVISEVKQIEISRKSEDNFLREDILVK